MATLFPRSANSDQYARLLASIYSAGPRLWDPSYALAQDPNVDEKVLRDPVIRKCCEARQLRAAGVEWGLDPATDEQVDKDWAGALEQCLKKIRGFTASRKNLADGIVKGRSYAFVEGGFGIDRFGDGVARRWWIPRHLRDVDRRRFRKVVTDRDGTRVYTAWSIYSIAKRAWVGLDETNEAGFVRFVYNDEEDTLGYGRGLLDSLYFPWVFRSTALQEGLQGLERWAQGWVVAKIDGMRDGSTGKTNATIQQDFLDVLEEHKSRHVMAFDSRDQVEVIQGGGEGWQIVSDLLRYMDQTIESMVLHSTLPTGGGPQDTGSYARAETEADSSAMVTKYDRACLSEALTDGLVALVHDMNEPARVALGLEGARCPRFRVGAEIKPDPKAKAEIGKMLLDAGAPVKKAEIYEGTGFTVPLPGDEVIEPRPSPLDAGFPGALGGADVGDDGADSPRDPPAAAKVRAASTEERSPDGGN